MTSPSLADLQRAMTQRILGSGDSASLDAWVRVPRGVDVEARLAVHRDGYPARIAGSLAEAFPAVSNIVGTGSLANLTHRYIESGECRESNLNRVGRRLPSFLANDPLSDTLPFLSDLAELEWAIYECFHSATGSDFDPTSTVDFSRDDWAEARIEFRPGTAIVSSAWPIRELWKTRDRPRTEIDVDLMDRPDRVLVHRAVFSVETRSVDRIEALALGRLLAGSSLGQLMTALSDEGAEPGRVNALFAHWTATRLVSACHSP